MAPMLNNVALIELCAWHWFIKSIIFLGLLLFLDYKTKNTVNTSPNETLTTLQSQLLNIKPNWFLFFCMWCLQALYRLKKKWINLLNVLYVNYSIFNHKSLSSLKKSSAEKSCLLICRTGKTQNKVYCTHYGSDLLSILLAFHRTYIDVIYSKVPKQRKA